MKNCLLILAFMPFLAAAAAAPLAQGSDIWLVELDASENALAAGSPRNLTRRPGYDNQPAFIGSDEFLFSSMDTNGQTDAWTYALPDGTAAPLRQTPESEYSPTPMPTGGVSVVQVTLSGVQQLWALPVGGEGYELLFPMLEGVGYHAWLDADHVALFLVRDPVPELHIANRKTGEVLKLAKDIGRALQPFPGPSASLAFTEAGPDGKRWIKRFDLAGRRLVPLAPLKEGSEDFAILPDGRLLLANGRALFAWNGDAWQELARFDTLPGTITRLAVSPDASRLLMVVAEGE